MSIKTKLVLLIALIVISISGIAMFQAMVNQESRQSEAQASENGGNEQLNRVRYLGKDWYLNGYNLPLFTWGCDFGSGCSWGGGTMKDSNYVSAEQRRMLKMAQDNGFNTVRWWLFFTGGTEKGHNILNHEAGNITITADANGKPTGIHPDVIAGVRNAVVLAEEYDFYINFSVFSGPSQLPESWIRNPEHQQALADVLGTLMLEFKNEPRIMSWELFNEPDFYMLNSSRNTEDVRALLTRFAAAIRANTHALHTVGPAHANTLYLFREIDVDYYSPHFYSRYDGAPDSGLSNMLLYDANTLRRDMGLLNKPIIVGEMNMMTGCPSPSGWSGDMFSRSLTDPALANVWNPNHWESGCTTTPLSQLPANSNDYRVLNIGGKLERLRQGGYAGAWAWTLLRNTGDTLWIKFDEVNTYVNQNYANSYGPRKTQFPNGVVPTISYTPGTGPGITIVPLNSPTPAPQQLPPGSFTDNGSFQMRVVDVQPRNPQPGTTMIVTLDVFPQSTGDHLFNAQFPLLSPAWQRYYQPGAITVPLVAKQAVRIQLPATVTSTWQAGTYYPSIGAFFPDWSGQLGQFENKNLTVTIGGTAVPTTLPPTATPVVQVSGTPVPTVPPVVTERTVVQASMLPPVINPGETSSARVRVSTPNAGAYLINVELYDSNGEKKAQGFIDNRQLPANTDTFIDVPFTTGQVSTLVSGKYTVKAGLFTAGWETLVEWVDYAGTFEVNPPEQKPTGVIASPVPSQPPVATATSAPTAVPTTQVSNPQGSSFYKGINMNGNAVTIDGNRWLAERDANVTTSNVNRLVNTNTNVTLSPTAPGDVNSMIRSFVWQYSPSITLNVIPNGTYQVYVYVWEDNNNERFTLSIQGASVDQINSGNAGQWARKGPYSTTVTNGTIRISTSGGAANISGIEIWATGSEPAVTATTQPSATTQPTAMQATTSPTSGQVTTAPVIPSDMSVIEVYAAGTHQGGTYPTIRILYYDTRSRRWITFNQISNVAGNPSSRLFNRYLVYLPVKLQEKRIRVQYMNDGNAGGQDRNLMLDKIIIDGTTYEVENRTKITASGMNQGEWLYSNGYFETQP